MTEAQPYEVRFASAAQRDLGRIPPRYAAAIVEFASLVLPTSPRRLGKALHNALQGLHSARRGDYRLIYELIERDRVVLVVRIDHRSRAYGRR